MSQYDWSPYAVGGAAVRADSFTGLDPAFAANVYAMTQAAHEAGIPLQITSAYRSPEVQARLYADAVKKYGSPEAARKWVAPPGHSQHNKGTAVDFAVNGGLLRDADSAEAKWIAANAAKYGLHVPMSWEPWQVEMAGSRGGTVPNAAPANETPKGILPGFVPEEVTLADAASDAGGILAGAYQSPSLPQIAPQQARAIETVRRENPLLKYLQALG